MGIQQRAVEISSGFALSALIKQAQIKREWTRGPDPPPLKNHSKCRSPSNTGPDPPDNHKAIKPAFNAGPAKRHLNGVSLAADDSKLIMVFESSLPLSTKKFGPPLTKPSG